MDPNLVGWWALDEGSGLLAHDLTGNGNHGTLEGTVPTWVDGISGKAVNFPGTNERIDCGNGSPLDDIGNGSFWISFWMKSKDSVPLNYGNLFSKVQTSDNRFELYSVGTTSRFAFILVKGGVYQDYVFSLNLDIFDGTLRHIVLVINRTTDKILCYVDTVKDATELNIDTLPADVSNTGNVVWGSRSGGSNPYEGYLDELRIYTGLPTEAKIKYLFEHPGDGKPVWFVNVDTGVGTVNIAEDVDKLKRTRIAHNDLRMAINNCRFQITDLTIANNFFDATSDIPLEILKTGVAWFKGKIRLNFDAAAGSAFESMGVEGVDYLADLQETIDESFAWQNYKVCDTGGTGTSILHQLLIKAGFALPDMTLTTINKTISWYVVERQEKKTFWNEISQLLYEYGYVLDVGFDGIFVMHKLYLTALSTSPLVDADMVHTLRRFRRRAKWEAARIQWHPVETLTDIIVFSDRTGGDETNPCKIPIANGAYYPPGSGASDIYAVYKVADADILVVQNASLRWNKTDDITLDSSAFSSKRALIKFLGGAPSGGDLLQFEIRGDAIIMDRTKINKSVVYKVVNTERILEYKSRFIEAEGDADQLSSDLAQYYDFAKYQYRFEVDPDFAIAIAQEFALASTSQSITQDVRVRQLDEDQHGVRLAICEGITEYAPLASEIQDIVDGGAALPRVETRLSHIIIVASSTYTGSYNWKCDGVADDVQIQEAIDEAIARGGTRVELTEGILYTAAAIRGDSDVIFSGRGDGTIIKKNGNFNAIECIGTLGSEKSHFYVRDLKITRDSADTNANFFIYFQYADYCQIQDVECDNPINNGILVDHSQSPKVKAIVHGSVVAGILVSTSSPGGKIEDSIAYDNAIGITLSGSQGIISSCECFDNGLGIHVLGDDNVVRENTCRGNVFGEVSAGGIKIASTAERTLVVGNHSIDNGDLIDRGNCESTTSPMIFGETVPLIVNALWARDNAQAYEGTYSYKYTKDVAAGTGASVDLADNNTSTDMHGLIAGLEYVFSCRIYIPSGGLLGTEIALRIFDFDGGFANTSQLAANIYDEWQEVSVTRTLRSAATGAIIRLAIGSGAENAELFYVDNIRLQPLGISNEHEQNFKDDGTDTQVG